MHILFGPHFDGSVYPAPWDAARSGLGNVALGPLGLAALFETQLGVARQSTDPALRTLAYVRKIELALTQAGKKSQRPFYSASFQTDAIGTAGRLLALRDELVLAGWNARLEWPGRLQDLALVEQGGEPTPAAFADRLWGLVRTEFYERFGDWHIELDAATALQPGPWQLLWQKLRDSKATMTLREEPAPHAATGALSADPGRDLGRFQRHLATGAPGEFAGDGTLLVVGAPSEAAAGDAICAASLSDGSRLWIVPEGDGPLFDRSVHRSGKPRPGLSGASAAHPVLQLLPLAVALVWEDFEPGALLEFLQLPVSPISAGLRRSLAHAFAEAPGLGPAWATARDEAVSRAQASSKPNGDADGRSLLEPLRVLVEGQRYPASPGIPSEALHTRLDFLRSWALRRAAKDDRDETALGSLASSIHRLQAMTRHLSGPLPRPLLERLVRLAQADGVSTGAERELGCLPFVTHPGSIAATVGDIVWWSCVDPGFSAPPPFWNATELAALTQAGVRLPSRAEQIARQWTAWLRPVRAARASLVLIIPETIAGERTTPHPLVDRLRGLGKSDKLHVSWDDWMAGERGLPKPRSKRVARHRLPAQTAALELERPIALRERESFSSLQKLFFQPQYWFLEYKAKLRATDLSVKSTIFLRGTIAHQVLQEFLAAPGSLDWPADKRSRWVTERVAQLARDTGLPLLGPQERPAYENMKERLPVAAAELARLLGENGYTFAGSEVKRPGTLAGQAIESNIDLVLEHGKREAIVDLKWGSLGFHRQEIETNRAIQLALYAITGHEARERSVGYFIINAARYLEPDPPTFSGSAAVPSGPLAELVGRMGASLEYRREQLASGLVEVGHEESVVPDDALAPPERLFYAREYQVILGELLDA